MALSTLNNLDKKFGRAIEPMMSATNPTGVREWERNHSPASVGTLDEFADYLVSLMDVPTDVPAIRMVLRQVCILWVVSESGTIYLAVEEFSEFDKLVPVNKDNVFCPRKLIFSRFPKKLGHPTLLEGGKGRIAGEIILELNGSGGYEWELNNRSGR